MQDKETTIEEMKKELIEFINERDWDQFHKPKDVSMALAGEVGEILEIFQWKSEEQIKEILSNPEKKEALRDEIADVFAYTLDLARVCDVDIAKAYENKMNKNRVKYPADKVKGKNHKYTHYEE